MWKFKSLTWLFVGYSFAFLHASINKDATKYHVYPSLPPKKNIYKLCICLSTCISPWLNHIVEVELELA